MIPRRLRRRRHQSPRPRYVITTDQPITAERAALLRQEFERAMRNRRTPILSAARIKEINW